jgi:hypothetical protein
MRARPAEPIDVTPQSFLKTGLAVVLGAPQFRRVCGTALIAMALAAAASIGVLR